MRKNRPEDKYIQVGCIVRIVEEKTNPKRTGLALGTEHPIVEPPNGSLNTHMSVHVMDKRGKIFRLGFQEFCITAKRIQTTGKPRRRRKRK